ncbi:GntR family transcriptional regulator [Arthrobacter sp. NPDC056727]|uniref:GntR family transcriptional regulator n=1 Tax=Arthrobacter sp. NPDC056727 TaxID=3345927 RepID=UPI00366ED189
MARSARQPLADKMYEVLLDEFMDGVRAAGEPLNIHALTRELEVSQTPLREALARLEHTGLVQRVALKGYRVAPPMSQREIAKLMAARLVLEPAMTYETGLRTTPEFLDELRGTIEDLEKSVEHADTERENFRLYWRSDDQFHQLIAAQCDNPFLETAYRSLGGQIQRFRLFSKIGRTGAKFAAAEHRAVYEALAAGEADRAAEMMREHISLASERNTAPR